MSRTRKHVLTGGKQFSHSCRNNGECPWCTRNRRYNELRDLEKSLYLKNEYKDRKI